MIPPLNAYRPNPATSTPVNNAKIASNPNVQKYLANGKLSQDQLESIKVFDGFGKSSGLLESGQKCVFDFVLIQKQLDSGDLSVEDAIKVQNIDDVEKLCKPENGIYRRGWLK